MIRRLAVLFVLLSAPVWAQSDVPLDDPALEARAQALMSALRCPTCQNQAITDSHADVARDMRIYVRQRLAAGDSEEAIKADLAARYGDWVLLQPPVDSRTYVLWLLPFALLALGLFIAWRLYRRQTPSLEGANPDEAQIRAMLAEREDRS